MTASATPRRNGLAATGPPSWKISSTAIRVLRMSSSAMTTQSFGFEALRHRQRQYSSSAAGTALKMQGGGDNEAARAHLFGTAHARREGFLDLVLMQTRHRTGYETRSKIRIGLQLASRRPSDTGMVRQIDRICDHGSGGIGSCGVIGQEPQRV